MSSNLYSASRQWASRPADERFESLEEMYRVTRDQYESATEAEGVVMRQLRVAPTVVSGDDDLVLTNPESGATAAFTDWSFRQTCSLVGAPSRYLAKLPGDLAADCLNNGLANLPAETVSNLLFHKNGSRVFRGMNSNVYRRVWNWEVAEFCLALREHDANWRVPPARPAGVKGERVRLATEADVLDMNSNFGLSVKVGDAIAPAGLYASSHDVFVFMVNQDRALRTGDEVLNRGFFISGSEVAGVTTHNITTFFYDQVCGNHIVWGAKNVFEVSYRHVGDLRDKIAAAYQSMRAFADAPAIEDEIRLNRARHTMLADTKDQVIDLVFENGYFTRKDAVAAYALAEEFAEIHGDPRSAWGFASGATRLSQQTLHTDRRHELDRAAAKVLNLTL